MNQLGGILWILLGMSWVVRGTWQGLVFTLATDGTASGIIGGLLLMIAGAGILAMRHGWRML